MENGGFYGKIYQKTTKILTISQKSRGRRKLMTVFSGTYRHSVDSKKRLFIPAKFREILGDEFMVTKNIDGCLDIITAEARDAIAEKLSILPKTQTAKIKRFLFSGAGDCTPDSQGRIVLPQQLLEYASIEKDVLIVGASDHIEIWNEELYEKNIVGESIDDLAEQMNDIGW